MPPLLFYERRLVLKKILEVIKQHKLYFGLIVVIFFLFIMGMFSNVKADIVDELPDFAQYAKDNGYDLDKNPYYVIMISPDGKEYYCAFSDQPFFVCDKPKSDTRNWNHWVCPASNKDIFIKYSISEKSFTKIDYNNYSLALMNYTYLLYSNHNLDYCDFDTEKSLGYNFFYAVPLKGTTSPTIGLNITTQTIMNGLTKEVLMIVPFLTVLVISFLALRKALVELALFLRKA